MNRKKIVTFLKFFIPIMVWFVLFHKAFMGKPVMTRHGLDYYHIIKHFVENLMRGVYPYWDPYGFWGRPDDVDLRFIGEFNPFLLLYAIFVTIRIPPPQAYILYSVMYFFLGMAGFYFFAKLVFQKSNLAWLCFMALTYSSFVIQIFNNFCIVLLFVPFIWSLYFIVDFSLNPSRHSALGAVFSLMMVAITYMPFYFIVLTLGLFLVGVALFYRNIPTLLRKYFNFITLNKLFCLFCVCAVIVSLIPGLLWHLGAVGGDYLASWRHLGSDDAHTASMGLHLISAGNIMGNIVPRALFSGLSYPENVLFYLSFWFYIVLAISIIVPITKRSLLYFVPSIFILLIMLTDLTPVHRYLYEHVFIFRLFRNTFYLFFLACPFIIIFCIEQVRLFLDLQPRTNLRRGLLILFIAAVHGLWWYVLNNMGDIILSSYLTVLLSAFIFIINALGLFQGKKNTLHIMMLCVLLLQPIQFFYFYNLHSLSTAAWFPTTRFEPRFSFVRPNPDQDTGVNGPVVKGQDVGGVLDTSGYTDWKFAGLRNSYILQRSIEQQVLQQYTKYKFYLYDNVEFLKPDNNDFKSLAINLMINNNTAFLYSDEEPWIPAGVNPDPPLQAQIVTGNTNAFAVTEFDLNKVKLETNFLTDKFLVYNDSFQDHWFCSINGKPTKIYRANFAFKGVWLPAGNAKVVFWYAPRWRRVLTGFLFVFFYAFFAWTVFELTSARKRKRHAR